MAGTSSRLPQTCPELSSEENHYRPECPREAAANQLNSVQWRPIARDGPVTVFHCQSRGRGFKSRRARQTNHTHRARGSAAPDVLCAGSVLVPFSRNRSRSTGVPHAQESRARAALPPLLLCLPKPPRPSNRKISRRGGKKTVRGFLWESPGEATRRLVREPGLPPGQGPRALPTPASEPTGGPGLAPKGRELHPATSGTFVPVLGEELLAGACGSAGAAAPASAGSRAT